MHIRAKLLIRLLIVAGVIVVSQPLTHAQKRFDTEITQIGDAQIQTMVENGFFPDRQSIVFWHDPEWSIDLLLPSNRDGVFSVRIQSRTGGGSIVALPERSRQIKSVIRAPDDRAIVSTEGSESFGFVILDLKKAKIVDDVDSSGIQISPNRRFILFDSWFANWDESVPHTFRLYDVLKTPRENTCGYMVRHSKHEKLDDYLRGIQVYPPMPTCSDNENNLGLDDGANFAWAPDSSKIVFADAKKGVMSLVLVTMLSGTHDLPKTSVYVLKGSQDVCAGAIDAGEKNCDYDVIQSLGWDGDSVKATFHRRIGTPHDLQLTLPVSAFVPFPSGAD